jgi:hypothetical protein
LSNTTIKISKRSLSKIVKVDAKRSTHIPFTGSYSTIESNIALENVIEYNYAEPT